jgi:hypothetical protein
MPLEFPTRKGNKTPYRFWTRTEEVLLRAIIDKHRTSIIADAKETFPYRSISSIENKIAKIDSQIRRRSE